MCPHPRKCFWSPAVVTHLVTTTGHAHSSKDPCTPCPGLPQQRGSRKGPRDDVSGPAYLEPRDPPPLQVRFLGATRRRQQAAHLPRRPLPHCSGRSRPHPPHPHPRRSHPGPSRQWRRRDRCGQPGRRQRSMGSPSACVGRREPCGSAAGLAQGQHVARPRVLVSATQPRSGLGLDPPDPATPPLRPAAGAPTAADTHCRHPPRRRHAQSAPTSSVGIGTPPRPRTRPGPVPGGLGRTG